MKLKFWKKKPSSFDKEVKYTQKALNSILSCSLAEDGIQGNLTNMKLASLQSHLVSVFNAKKYRTSQGINLTALRMSDRFTNRFTDYYIIWNPDKADGLRVFPCSTKSGMTRVRHPKWVLGLLGVAVMKEGQYLDAYSYQDNWWSGLNFLYQIGKVIVFRDGNRDSKIDRVSEQEGLFGINQHSWLGFVGRLLRNLSEGCIVFTPIVLSFLLKYWVKASHKQDGAIDFTLIHLNDFRG